MSLFDALLIVITAVCAARSLMRGAARELFSLAGLLLAGIAASRYHTLLVPLLEPYLPHRWEQTPAALIAVFLAVYISMFLAGLLLSQLLKAISLGLLDRGAGLLVGMAKAYLISCGIVIGLLQFQPGAALVQRSQFAPYCQAGLKLASETVAPQLKPFLKQQTPPKGPPEKTPPLGTQNAGQ